MDTVHSLFVRLDMRTHVRVRMHARVQISRVFLHLLDINRLQNYSAIGFIFFTFFYFFSFHHYWPASFFFLSVPTHPKVCWLSHVTHFSGASTKCDACARPRDWRKDEN